MARLRELDGGGDVADVLRDVARRRNAAPFGSAAAPEIQRVGGKTAGRELLGHTNDTDRRAN